MCVWVVWCGCGLLWVVGGVVCVWGVEWVFWGCVLVGWLVVCVCVGGVCVCVGDVCVCVCVCVSSMRAQCVRTADHAMWFHLHIPYVLHRRSPKE